VKSYSFAIETQRSAKEAFELLLEIEKWWSGIYDETIIGKNQKVNDEFTFSARGGIHFSRQKLIELIPYKKIVWEVIESNLSFLENPGEWLQTKLQFEVIEETKNMTKIIFTHEGLIPQIECYNDCSNAWTQYLNNLQSKLK
jgi:hypothetical protein